MKRPALAIALATATAAALAASLVPGCTASVDSGCVGGPCGDDSGVPPASDAGVCVSEPGGEVCYADYRLVDKCDPSTMPTDGDIPCDIWAVMHKQPLDSGGCHKCHENPPIGGSPFPEVSYQDLLKESGYGTPGAHERVFQSMAKALSANLSCGPTGYTPMPFVTSKKLSCADSLKLSTWLTKCAPPADPGKGGAACCAAQDDAPAPDAGCPDTAP
jgi:hypothetical protein